MTDLEMVLVLVSMVLASGMVRALEGAVALLVSERRSWLAAAFLYHSFVYPVTYLLALLSYRDTDFSIAQHFLALLVASCLFVRAHIAATSHPVKSRIGRTKPRRLRGPSSLRLPRSIYSMGPSICRSLAQHSSSPRCSRSTSDS